MPGGNKKVTHTETTGEINNSRNKQLFKYV